MSDRLGLSGTTSADGATVVTTTVVGRCAGEQLALRMSDGGTISVRVRGHLWDELKLGEEAVLELGADGRPRSIRLGGA